MNIFYHIKVIWDQFLEGFKISNSGNVSKVAVCSFLGGPLVLGIIVGLFASIERFSEYLLAGTSIYMGFLVSMLIPFLNFIENQENYADSFKATSDDERRTLSGKILRLKQYRIMYSQVVFALLVSIVSVFVQLLFFSIGNYVKSLYIHIAHEAYVVDLVWGKYFFNLLNILVYSFQFLNLFILLLIVISANAIIYPLLCKMTKTVNSTN